MSYFKKHMIQLALIEDDEVVRITSPRFFFRQEEVNCRVIAASVEDFFEKTERIDSWISFSPISGCP